MKSLLDFKYCLKHDRKVMFIDNNYLNYVLSCLRKSQVSYVVICINYGYEKSFEYKACYNQYSFYYKRGKRLIKNLQKIEFILDKLKRSKDIDLLRGVERIIDDNSYRKKGKILLCRK